VKENTMATTPEKAQQDQQDFASAYNEEQSAAPEQTEDEAFGIEPEAHETLAEDVTEEVPQDASAAEGGAEGQAGNDAQGSAPALVVIEPGATDSGDVQEEDPKDIQRQKSWEGRLKAKEAELKAREEALNAPAETTQEASEPGETMAEEAAEPAVTEKIEEAVEKVASGEMTADEAMASLSQDFGEDFTKMLGVLIESKAKEISNKTADERMSYVDNAINKSMDEIINEIINDKAKNHFEVISDAHPDFMEIAGGQELKDFIGAMDESERAKALEIIEGGTSRQISKLLTAFKDANKQPEPQDESGMDAAEGVRSKGALQIPNKPMQSADYEDAWSSF
jgi:hypothetical protein